MTKSCPVLTPVERQIVDVILNADKALATAVRRAFGVQRSLTGMGSGRRYFLACFIQHGIKMHLDRRATSFAFFPHRT